MTLQERLRERPIRYATETEDEAKLRRQRDREEAAAELDRLQARVAELEVDAERLDALQANPRWHVDCEVLKFGAPGKWRVWSLRGNQMHSTSIKYWGEGDTLRAAIDTARKAKP